MILKKSQGRRRRSQRGREKLEVEKRRKLVLEGRERLKTKKTRPGEAVRGFLFSSTNIYCLLCAL